MKKGSIKGKSRNSDFTLDKINLSTSVVNCNKLGTRHPERRVHNADGHRGLLTEEETTWRHLTGSKDSAAGMLLEPRRSEGGRLRGNLGNLGGRGDVHGNKLGVKGEGRGGGEKGVLCRRNTEACKGLRLECGTREGSWQVQ